jgi:hypothetical protein
MRDLITVEDCMTDLQLGPNGGILYCMQFLSSNISWLLKEIEDLSGEEQTFLIIDCPGIPFLNGFNFFLSFFLDFFTNFQLYLRNVLFSSLWSLELL